jgi:hypothetical protein
MQHTVMGSAKAVVLVKIWSDRRYDRRRRTIDDGEVDAFFVGNRRPDRFRLCGCDPSSFQTKQEIMLVVLT